MTFYIIVVMFLMTLLRNEATNILIQAYFTSSTLGIFCTLTFCDEKLSRIIETWMKDHLVSDKNYSTVN